MKRYAVAVRVSTEDQGEKKGKTSLASQRAACEEYVARDGGEVVKAYTEDGVSGGLEYLERETIVSMLEDARAGEFDAVVWHKPDRQGRSTVETILIEQELAKAGVEVHTVETGMRQRETSDGLLIEGVRDAVSASEKLRIKERMAQGRYSLTKLGYWTGGMAPMGYAVEADGRGSRLVVHEGEAEVIRRAFELIAEGLSARQVAEVLNREFAALRKDGTLPKRKGGQGWGNQHVGAWIRKPGYYGAGFERAVAPHPSRPRETVSIPAETLVSEELWLRANEALTGRKATSKAPTEFLSHPYGLATRVKHVHPDGSDWTMFGIARAEVGTRAYRCTASVPRRGRFAQDDPDRCPGCGVTPKGHRRTSIDAGTTEALLMVEILDRLKDPASFQRWVRDEESRRLDEARRAGLVGETVEETLAEVEKALAEVEAERAILNRQERKGRIGEEAADEAHADLDRQTSKLEAVKVAAMKRAADERDRTLTIGALMTTPVGYRVDTVAPGDEREVFIAEDGTEVVEAPGWTDVAKWLHAEALKVLEGGEKDLSREAVEWLARMAQVFDIVVTVHDVGEKLPRIEATGAIPLGSLVGATRPIIQRRPASPVAPR